jgi:hypothetical protein
MTKLSLSFLIAMGMSCGSDSTKSTGIYGSTVLQGSGSQEICRDSLVQCGYIDSRVELHTCPHPVQILEIIKGEGYFWGGCVSDPKCVCRCPRKAPPEPERP